LINNTEKLFRLSKNFTDGDRYEGFGLKSLYQYHEVCISCLLILVYRVWERTPAEARMSFLEISDYGNAGWDELM